MKCGKVSIYFLIGAWLAIDGNWMEVLEKKALDFNSNKTQITTENLKFTSDSQNFIQNSIHLFKCNAGKPKRRVKCKFLYYYV